MMQVARHSTMEAWGCLSVGQSLLHDREGQYGPVLQQSIATAGVMRGLLPPRSPHRNASAERWVRSVTEACRARWIRCGEASLPHALAQLVAHGHHERYPQGKRHVLRLPAVSHETERQGPMACRERRGGLLQDDTREAACIF
jgi:hypothetical protein